LSRSKAEGMPRMDGRRLTVCGLKALESELQPAELLQCILMHTQSNILRIKRMR